MYSEKDKDSIEAEIGLTVKAVGQQIETLKNSVLAAQGSPLAPPAAVAALKEQKQARGDASDKPNINEQTAAHLHGVVGTKSPVPVLKTADVKYTPCMRCLHDNITLA